MKKLDYNQNLYYKTIVCDFDDTISNTLTKDWKNSKPNIALINQLNHLFDLGWQIIILTARGQISCNGDYELADKKYRKDIEQWLNDNGVKYTKLSFQKYLGLYYVDDKNLSINDFINLKFYEFKKGLSGAEVYRVNNLVYKTNPEIINEVFWYKCVEGIIKTPKIHTFIGSSITLDYLEENTPFNIYEIIRVINKLKSVKNSNTNDFSSYIDRIRTHCEINNDFFQILDELEKYSDYLNQFKTFCHGDLSVDNILFVNNEANLIDPIFNNTFYSSILLDISKLLFSLKYNNKIEEYHILYDYYLNKYDPNVLKLLEITQIIRVIKYQKSLENREILIKLVKSEIDGYFKDNIGKKSG